MERNFLMSVSHELRTPLTAIRGHVVGAARGRRRRSGARAAVAGDGRGGGDTARAARRRHPRPRQARHAPLHRHARGGRHGRAASTRRTRRYRDEARRREIDYRQEVRDAARDHLGRRPRAAGRRQPALERVPARRRTAAASSSRSRSRTARSRRGGGLRARASRAESRERLFRPFVSDSTGGTGLGLAIAQGALRPRSAAGSSSSRNRATGRGSSSSCRRLSEARRSRAGARRSTGSAARAASMRASRASIARQPSVSRSTSRPRSSTRALRSDSISPSSRSSLRIALFERPFTSARRREIGAASSRRVAVIASRICTVLSSTTRRSYRPHRMESRELDYDLPPELIAQHPADRRDESRLLVFDRAPASAAPRLPRPARAAGADVLAVVNDTRVVPARIPIDSPRGEVLLLERVDGDVWEALARPTRRLRAGRDYGPVHLLEHLGEGRWRVRLSGEPSGQAPLPPYITEPLADPERYQTVYAREQGSPPHRRPACTSQTSCSRDSTSSESPCTSASTRSGRCSQTSSRSTTSTVSATR